MVSGGGVHAGRLHAQGSGQGTAAHRAQLHAGAGAPPALQPHQADAAALIGAASINRTAQEDRGVGRCYFPFNFPFSDNLAVDSITRKPLKLLRFDGYANGNIHRKTA